MTNIQLETNQPLGKKYNVIVRKSLKLVIYLLSTFQKYGDNNKMLA